MPVSFTFNDIYRAHTGGTGALAEKFPDRYSRLDFTTSVTFEPSSSRRSFFYLIFQHKENPALLSSPQQMCLINHRFFLATFSHQAKLPQPTLSLSRSLSESCGCLFFQSCVGPRWVVASDTLNAGLYGRKHGGGGVQ